jgi:hypothetical protein
MFSLARENGPDVPRVIERCPQRMEMRETIIMLLGFISSELFSQMSVIAFSFHLLWSLLPVGVLCIKLLFISYLM